MRYVGNRDYWQGRNFRWRAERVRNGYGVYFYGKSTFNVSEHVFWNSYVHKQRIE